MKVNWVYFGTLKMANWDTLEVHMKEKPFTRQGMLSSLSSVYDPHRLAAPFMLDRKGVIQSLSHQNLDWDEQIPDSRGRQWVAWKANLLILEDIKVERCFKPKKFGN